MNKVGGRFAPSPSGRMHLGNLWSCLLAWLCAAELKWQGKRYAVVEEVPEMRTPVEQEAWRLADTVCAPRSASRR